MYHRVTIRSLASSNRMRRVICRPTPPRLSTAEARQMSSDLSHMVHDVKAPNISQAQEPAHVRSVSEMLRQHGILKISLGFDDVKSRYLEQLLLSLHQHHGHQLPIAHSATKGWFWDVLPTTTSFQTANCQARSETMDEFPWHTDCSYENPPPRYFALHVLQPDRYGGGTLSVLNVQRLSELLSATTKASLARPEYLIRTPPEFEKSPKQQHIVGSIMETDANNQTQIMRFREDILTPLSKRASAALNELKHVVQSAEARSHSTLHLTPKALPARSIILLDNRRWLHARNHITDPGRHLRRVRWDAVPFTEKQESTVGNAEIGN